MKLFRAIVEDETGFILIMPYAIAHDLFYVPVEVTGTVPAGTGPSSLEKVNPRVF